MAMSGGVDSAVAAALLVEQGYEVLGVTMQIWPELPDDILIKEEHTGCCSLAAVEDARRVADAIGITYYVLNFKAAFEHRVIDYFVAEYARGRTPNPCIACNRYIKFDALMDKARQLECDKIATGHYARVARSPAGRWLLLRPADRAKDQTYVLYNLTQQQLAHTLFPLGGLTKPEVRERARRLGFVVHDKPDSQEICFVPTGNYTDFLRERIPAAMRPGPIYSTDGRLLGQHKGLPRYTIGQRRGLGLAAPEPLYVVHIDPARNALVVGARSEAYQSRLVADDLNWIACAEPDRALRIEAQIRATTAAAPACLEPLAGGRAAVTFDEPQHAVTPGQAVVFYQGEVVLGGGTIAQAPALRPAPSGAGQEFEQ